MTSRFWSGGFRRALPWSRSRRDIVALVPAWAEGEDEHQSRGLPLARMHKRRCRHIVGPSTRQHGVCAAQGGTACHQHPHACALWGMISRLRFSRADTQAASQVHSCGGSVDHSMTTVERTALERCLLIAFQQVLSRHDIALRTHHMARMQLPVPTPDPTPLPLPTQQVPAHLWALALHCGSRVGYSAWVVLVPGAIPDLLDVIAPSALEAPGPIPHCLVEPPCCSASWQQGILRHWGRAVHAHDELQALLASLTPDAATAACLLADLCTATVQCDWMLPPPEAPAG